MSDSNDIQSLWNLIDRGDADAQQRVEAITLAGKLQRREFASRILGLLDDIDSEVRYYALSALVLDLGERSNDIVSRCRRTLKQDPNEDVRAMAATCIGQLFFGTYKRDIFDELLSTLRGDAPWVVKRACYTSLFTLSGKGPKEWPRSFGPMPSPPDAGIDWAKVAMLEDEMRRRDFRSES